MSDQDQQDALANLLSGLVLPPTDHSQREAVFAQTQGVLRRRRVTRRVLQVTSLAACYFVGVLSVLGWQSIQLRNGLAHQQNAAVDGPSVVAVQEPDPAPKPDQTAAPVTTEVADHLQQPIETLTKFERLRRAGDRQLIENGNLQGAIGCYRRALDFASDDELKIVPERDSWLLIPLKEVRLEARKHAQKKT